MSDFPGLRSTIDPLPLRARETEERGRVVPQRRPVLSGHEVFGEKRLGVPGMCVLKSIYVCTDLGH